MAFGRPTYKTRKKARSSRVRNLVAFSSFIILLFGMIVLYQAFGEYKEATDKGHKNADRLMNIISDHVEVSLMTADLVLQRAVERQHLNLLFGGNLPEDMLNNFNVWVKDTPQIVAMAMIDKKGDIDIAVHEQNYEGWIDYNRSVMQFDSFVKMRDNPDIITEVSILTAKTRGYGRNIVLLSRRVDDISGAFGGVVIAAIPIEYFLDFFKSIDNGVERYMSIFLENGINLFATISHSKTNSELFNIIQNDIFQQEVPKIATNYIKDIKGSVKIVSYKHINKFPLIVSLVIGEDDFLSGFWQNRLKDLSFLAIFTLFGSVLSFFALAMARQIMRVEDSESAAILASQAKSEFLANMSHELRTPLNAIIGFSEMMNSGYFGPLNGKQKERMKDINLCGNHLLQLITDILEFSKGDAGRMELVEEKVDIELIIDEVSRMMNEKVRMEGVKLITKIADDMPLIFADKRKLKQILINLISNATKFTPRDGKIKVSAYIDSNGAMSITVRDTGVGIAEEDIATALAVFGQVHRNKSHEGTGLGLPLCRMFTELHGGKLLLTSSVGAGTTVKILIPAERVILETRPTPESKNFSPVEGDASPSVTALGNR